MRKIVMALLGGVFAVNTAFAALHSLTTKFSDVILSNMKPGMVYSLKKEKGIPFGVINNTGKEENVEVKVEKPTKSQLKEYYEPIPDVSWISVFPSKFKLSPGENMDCDVIISIPPDKKYANRHFQAMLTVQTVRMPGSSGLSINLALASRIRFSTGKTPAKLMEEYRKKIFEALKLELTPLSLFFRDIVKVGRKVKLNGVDYPTIQLINKGRKNYKVTFRIAGNPEKYGINPDYEPMPKEIKVKFKKKKMKAKKRSIRDVVMELKVPDKKEFYGKSYAFVVVGKVLGFDIPIEVFSRVYFKTQKAQNENAELAE